MKKLMTLLFVSTFAFMACDPATNAISEQELYSEKANEVMLKKGADNSYTILSIAASADDFSILAAAVEFSELGDALDGRRQLTVFAPTNDAFAKLLTDEIDTPVKLLNALGKETVKDILLYHVAPGEREASSVVESTRIRMLAKKFTFIQSDGENLQIGNTENGFANIIGTDIDASNGVIHVIDTVLLPPTSVKGHGRR